MAISLPRTTSAVASTLTTPLNFQRLNKVGADLLVRQQLPTDAFDDPAYRLNVGRGLKVEVPTGRNFPTTCGPVTSPPVT